MCGWRSADGLVGRGDVASSIDRSTKCDEVRVLVVGEDQRDWELARAALADDVALERTRNAESALVRMRESHYDIVISDLTLPQLSGLDLLERVSREHPKTDFIIAAENDARERVMAAFRLGVAGLVDKPFEAAEITHVVRRVIEQRALSAKSRRLEGMMETLSTCSSLIPCVEVPQVYARSLDLLIASLGCTRGIALYHRGPVGPSEGIVIRGFPDEFSNRLRVALIDEKRIPMKTSAGSIELLEDSPVRELIRELGYESQGPILMAPVTSMGEAWGILWILTEDVEIDELAIERAETVVDHAVLALENAEKYIHAKERAFIDDCTGLYNARYLYTSAENEISRSERYGSELTFVFLDLDRFKLVNDNYGHLVGSRTLRKVGEVLLSCVRQVDMVARYGGDEFTILLADTSHEGGMQVSERIREMIEETEFETDTDVSMRLTVSIGVASYPEHGEARDELLDAADKAMYHAKLMGRNKVSSIAEVPASTPDSKANTKANTSAKTAAKTKAKADE